MAEGLSREIGALLRCPETRQPLHEASPAELESFDADLSEGGFITEDGSRVYPIRDGFPVLIAAECLLRR